MGTSTDAILAFGFDFGEEKPEFMYDETVEDYFYDLDDYMEHIENVPDDADWETRKKAWNKCPAIIEHYCSSEYKMYFLAMKGSVLTVNRGDCEVVDAGTYNLEEEKIREFIQWCRDRGIKGEPKWHLMSYWG